jgi:murein L,D-transpeptidase YcbB/YkuD
VHRCTNKTAISAFGEQKVMLKQKVQVYITHFTAFADEVGAGAFYKRCVPPL